jgi:quinol monooxygenase YgiN
LTHEEGDEDGKMSRITVVARIKAKSEFADEIRRQLKGLVEPTRTGDEGCITYDLYQADEDPSLFYFLEEWESRELLEKHLDSGHVQSHLKKSAGKLEDRAVDVLRRII